MDKIAAEPGFIDGPMGRRFYTIVFQEVGNQIYSSGVVLDPTGQKWPISVKTTVPSMSVDLGAYRLEARRIADDAIKQSNDAGSRAFRLAANANAEDVFHVMSEEFFHAGRLYQLGYKFTRDGNTARWEGLVGREQDYFCLNGLVDISGLEDIYVKTVVQEAVLREVSHL